MRLTLGLRSNGEVVAWGGYFAGVAIPGSLPLPATQIAAGVFQGLALLTDGTIAIWGADYSQTGNLNVPALPPGLVYTDIASGNKTSCALRSDGNVVAWGDNTNGASNVPSLPSGMIYIDVAQRHELELRSPTAVDDGTRHARVHGVRERRLRVGPRRQQRPGRVRVRDPERRRDRRRDVLPPGARLGPGGRTRWGSCCRTQRARSSASTPPPLRRFPGACGTTFRGSSRQLASLSISSSSPPACRQLARSSSSASRHFGTTRERSPGATSRSQHLRLQRDARRAVLPRPFQLVAHPAGRQQRQPALRDRRPARYRHSGSLSSPSAILSPTSCAKAGVRRTEATAAPSTPGARKTTRLQTTAPDRQRATPRFCRTGPCQSGITILSLAGFVPCSEYQNGPMWISRPVAPVVLTVQW